MGETMNKPHPIPDEGDWDFARQHHRDLIEQTRGRLPRIFRLNLLTTALGIVLVIIGSILAIATPSWQTPEIALLVSGIIVLVIGATCLVLYRSTMAQVAVYINEPITNSEWEAARRKIQYYMHENLRQVHWIFWLNLVAMFLGFLIILSGAALAIWGPKELAPSIVGTLSGVLVEFLGATFLMIYKSTMEQAKTYVSILERINAIGMSEKLVESIEPEQRDQVRARMASEILLLHGVENTKSNVDE